VTTEFDLSEVELAILRELVRTVDRLDGLNEVILKERRV